MSEMADRVRALVERRGEVANRDVAAALSDNIPFEYDDEAVKLIVSRCTELESGGRMIDAILTNTVLPRISEEFLKRMVEGKSVGRVHVKVEGGEFAYRCELV